MGLKNPLLEKLRKETPLEIRLRVHNHAYFLCFLVDNGYIPDGYWTDEKEEKYGKQIHEFVTTLTDSQLKEVKEWEEDGRPD